MSTFAFGAAPEPGDHVIPHASMLHGCRHVLQVPRTVRYVNPLKVLMPLALFVGLLKGGYDMVMHPLHFANDTILIFVTGMILAPMALLADPIVRSHADT